MRSALQLGALVISFGFLTVTRVVNAQAPEGSPPGADRAERSLLGAPLGASIAPQFGGTPADEPVAGGTGPGVPRVPAMITQPGQQTGRLPEQDQIRAPAILQPGEIPLYGPLETPSDTEDEGPPDGLTLDAAIDRLVHENLAIRARYFELPQADADILTASLRANPILFADSQLIPYGSYSDQKPGGPVQYDVNITYPLDVTHKRRARTEVAQRARRVLEAQYQDAVRLQIDNLYTAYTDVLAARETIRFAQAARQGLNILLDRTQRMQERGTRTIADVSRIESMFEASEVQVMDSEEAMRTAKRALGVLLNMAPGEAEQLELRGSIRETSPPPPGVDTLIPMAIDNRPDVAAFRLAIQRAESDVKLARANRMSDVFLLAQPYTFQDNSPFNKQSTHSWALGMTVPLPIYNRNQGNIQRAVINVTQTKVELEEREQIVINEVQRAEREYVLTRRAIDRIEQKLLPSATRARDDTYRLVTQGEEDVFIYLNAQREFNEASRQYRDMLVRHRRSMLLLNTAVGQRLLP